MNAHIYFVDELLYFALKAPPLELDGDEFVCTHSWSVRLCTELCLLKKKKISRIIRHINGGQKSYNLNSNVKQSDVNWTI